VNGAGRTRTEGFSLIEIAIVIMVAAIIIPAVILPFVEATRGMDRPVILGTMAFLAQHEMEKKIVAYNFHSISAWADSPIGGFPGYSSSCTIDPNVTFGPVTEGAKLVTVTVTGGGYDFELVTVKTDWEE